MNSVKNFLLGAFALLVGTCIVLAFMLALSMMFEIFTGIDVIREYIRPFFGRS